MKIDIAGVQVVSVLKQEAIAAIDQFVQNGQPHLVTTPYSELIVFAQRDENYKKVLNSANLSLPDSIGILWAGKFLSLQRKKQFSIFNFHFSNLILSLAAIIFYPAWIRSVIKEQVTGSHLIWDVARLASDKNYSLALVGGKDSVAQKAAERLKVSASAQGYGGSAEALAKAGNSQKLAPYRSEASGAGLKVNLALSDCEFDDALVERINQSNSDILLIAYSPPKQEMWLAQNLQKLNVKVAIGLGGTFDYIAGKQPQAPKFLHDMGLEWLWRLITQPWRIKRMWNAVPVFIWKVYKYKLKNYGLRIDNS